MEVSFGGRRSRAFEVYIVHKERAKKFVNKLENKENNIWERHLAGEFTWSQPVFYPDSR